MGREGEQAQLAVDFVSTLDAQPFARGRPLAYLSNGLSLDTRRSGTRSLQSH